MYGIHGRVYAQKIALLPLPIPESNHNCTSDVLFFPQIAFWRYKAI